MWTLGKTSVLSKMVAATVATVGADKGHKLKRILDGEFLAMGLVVGWC